jgi:hypothetical protein
MSDHCKIIKSVKMPNHSPIPPNSSRPLFPAGPSTSNATASVTAATAQMCMYDMDSQQNVMVPWRESDANRLSVMSTLASLPPLFPPTPSLMLPPPPPPPQIPPPPPPPAHGIEVEADPLVYENPENHLHYEDPEDNPRWRPVFLSDLPFEDGAFYFGQWLLLLLLTLSSPPSPSCRVSGRHRPPAAPRPLPDLSGRAVARYAHGASALAAELLRALADM